MDSRSRHLFHSVVKKKLQYNLKDCTQTQLGGLWLQTGLWANQECDGSRSLLISTSVNCWVPKLRNIPISGRTSLLHHQWKNISGRTSQFNWINWNLIINQNYQKCEKDGVNPQNNQSYTGIEPVLLSSVVGVKQSTLTTQPCRFFSNHSAM